MNIKQWAKHAINTIKNPKTGSWLEQSYNMAMGFVGETRFREYLETKSIQYMQADVLFKHPRYKCKKNPFGYVVGEVKHQEKFKAGPNMPNPFDGHGLPTWQFKARLKLHDELGVEPVLIVFDPEIEGFCYYQSMTTLNSLPDDEKYTTTTNPRVIFPLEKFIKIKL